MPPSIRFALMSPAIAAILAGCSSSPPPQTASQPPSPPQATELRDTIQKPLDRAKSVEGIIMKSKDHQDQQLQSQEGDDASPASQ